MMHKTDIMDMVARKLAPYMLLFGFYLVSYGDVSPGGGFQGGVVIASGLILLALARDVESAERLFSSKRLSAAEAAAYVLLLGSGVTGLLLGAGFLGDFPGRGDEGRIVPAARFIFLLNLAIGVKVASGAGLICMALFRDEGEGSRGVRGDSGGGSKGISEELSQGGPRGGSGGGSKGGPKGVSEGLSKRISKGGAGASDVRRGDG